MKIKVNDREMEVMRHASLLQAVLQIGVVTPFAVAVNGCFVPQQDYVQYLLKEGDHLDIVHPVAGG